MSGEEISIQDWVTSELGFKIHWHSDPKKGAYRAGEFYLHDEMWWEEEHLAHDLGHIIEIVLRGTHWRLLKADFAFPQKMSRLHLDREIKAMCWQELLMDGWDDDAINGAVQILINTYGAHKNRTMPKLTKKEVRGLMREYKDSVVINWDMALTHLEKAKEYIKENAS